LAPDVTLSVITVTVQEALAPVVAAVEFGVPVPVIVIPMPGGTTMPLVHVQDPAGMMMVSPLTATRVGPLMTALTSF